MAAGVSNLESQAKGHCGRLRPWSTLRQPIRSGSRRHPCLHPKGHQPVRNSPVALQYDFATNVISSEGKVYQLEYATKAVESAG